MRQIGRRTVLTAGSLGTLGMLSLASTNAASAADAKTVRAGEIAPIAIFWPGLIAVKNGFYPAEGVQVELNYVGGVTASVQQLIGGSLDFAYTTCEVALQAAEKGADISIVGGTAIKYPYSMMSARDVKTAADLKGKKVILPPPRQDIAIFFDRWLRENGVKPEEVDKVYDGATPNRYAALASGTVAAAAVSQPFDFRAAADGYNKLVDFGIYVKDYAFVVILARKPWLKENGDTAKAYLRAVSHSIDWFYDKANRGTAIDILSAASKQDQTIVAKTYDYYCNELMPFSRKLEVPKASLQNVATSLGSLGILKSPQLAANVLDLSYAPH
jgi:ABC-type nitrate/sulfonate/bicarbonate transport system substrate-binding protein